jgi:hypothetical protein
MNACGNSLQWPKVADPMIEAYTSSKMCALSSHLDKRLTRLSGLARSRHFGGNARQWAALAAHDATDESCRVKCWAKRPLGSFG